MVNEYAIRPVVLPGLMFVLLRAGRHDGRTAATLGYGFA
jgi:hypothetical protein